MILCAAIDITFVNSKNEVNHLTVCGRKQFGRSKYCGNCGNRLIWEEENES